MIARFLVLALLLFLAILANLCFGAVSVTPAQVWQALNCASSSPSTVRDIIWQIRLPRMLCAMTVGCALSVSGYLLQALCRNYLADPFLTGVSSGAAVAVAAGILLNLSFSVLPAAALFGGLTASILVALMARTANGLSITRLLLSGIAVSAVCSSLITLTMTSLASAGRIQGLFYWLAGSISGKGWLELQPAAIYIGLALLSALILSKPLRVLGLGAPAAASLGLNVPLMQWLTLLTAVVLCGTAVSLSGLVGFVGLVAPYIARSAFGRDERWHIIAAAGTGAILLLLSDLCARTLSPGQELPLSTLLSLVGAPFFLFLVLKHKDEAK